MELGPKFKDRFFMRVDSEGKVLGRHRKLDRARWDLEDDQTLLVLSRRLFGFADFPIGSSVDVPKMACNESFAHVLKEGELGMISVADDDYELEETVSNFIEARDKFWDLQTGTGNLAGRLMNIDEDEVDEDEVEKLNRIASQLEDAIQGAEDLLEAFNK